YRDGGTLDKHMAVLAEQMQLLPSDLTAVMAYLEPVRIEVFGRPDGAAAAMDAGLRAAGVPFAAKPRYLGGFARSRTRKSGPSPAPAFPTSRTRPRGPPG